MPKLARINSALTDGTAPDFQGDLTLLLLSDPTAPEGSIFSFRIVLAEPAGTGGVTVDLNASPADAVSVPTTITIPEGATTADFFATSGDVTGNTPFSVNAILGGSSASAGGTVLDPQDQPPIANDDLYIAVINATLHVTADQGVLTGSGPLHNGADTDAENDPLSAILVSGPAHGSLGLLADGSFTYTPDVDYAGADSFTYKANDGGQDSNVATVNLQVQTDSGGNGNDLTLLRLSDPTEPEGSTFNFRVVLSAPAGPGGVTVTLDASPFEAVSIPATVIVVEGATTADFSAESANVTGNTQFSITATVGNSMASAGGTIIDLQDQPPTANNDHYITQINTILHITADQGVLTGIGTHHNGADTDPENDPLTAVLVSGPKHGSLFLVDDGSFIYTPETDYTGADSFTYEANDGTHDSNVATVNLQINPENDTGGGGGDLTLLRLGGQAEPEGSNFDFRVVLANPAGPGGVTVTLGANPVDVVSIPATITIFEGATTADFFASTVDVTGNKTFSITATLGGSSASAGGTIIDLQNQPPTANDDHYSVAANATLDVTLDQGVLKGTGLHHTGADTDPENDPLSAILVTGAAHGALVLLADGSFVYKPDAGYSGADTFTYKANDGQHDSNVATVDLTVQDLGGPPCYCRGTRIMTDRGEVAVEALRIGDHVPTEFGPTRRIRWIGRRSYDPRFIASRPDILPIVIRQGALSDGVPARDLFVSPAHAMFLDGVLVPAQLLINGRSIVQLEQVDELSYFHIELDTHDVILAEGAPSESFVDCNGRTMFHNWHEFAELYPEGLGTRWAYCAERVEDGRMLDTIRRRIAARAGLSGSHVEDSAEPGIPEGYLDGVDCGGIWGWAYDPARPHSPLHLEILVDGVAVDVVVANSYRGDLKDAGKGTGRYAFRFRFDVPLTADVAHRVEVKMAPGWVLEACAPAIANGNDGAQVSVSEVSALAERVAV